MPMTIEVFKTLFRTHKEHDEGAWEVEEDLSAVKEQVEMRAQRLKEIRGDELYQGNKALADVLESVDEFSLALQELEYRWEKLSSFLVKQALKDVGKTIYEMKQNYAKVKSAQVSMTENDEDLCMRIDWGFEAVDRVYKSAKAALDDRREEETGTPTGKSKGELIEGWNGINQRYEFKHPDEWKRLVDRDKLELDWLFDPDSRLTKMEEVGSGVHVLHDDGKSKERLEEERKATTYIREHLTENVNGRTGKAKEDVKNNSDMAKKLVGLLTAAPEMLQDGGMLNRIMGGIQGQGQFPSGSDPQVVIDGITNAGERMKEGTATGQDANQILQFISCFVDGITEAIEGKPKAVEQFDKIWPHLRDAFGLVDDDKGNLLRRVQGYKEIAGGVSDTLSGKGTRKDDTRKGLMPTDTDYKIEDEDALIKGDISGSMHSCLLAQELAECLMGREEGTGSGKKVVRSGLKARGDSVLVTDPDLLNARALDALALTAGGKLNQGAGKDLVLHTAYEMINGMRAISGTPKVSQPQASTIMAFMLSGGTFTAGMEAVFPREKLPWCNTV